MEAANSPSNSSKVIVQCHDPSDLFSKTVPVLQPRLPLNKLHWKSPNRPLRSIDELNVSFVRDDSKSDITSNVRRHQIPGLRQTPFVKLLLVRCDDRETYKEVCRKDIKQWLKNQGISSDGKTLAKGQERHDAFEYIILHVVLPGTAAATQPKSSKHISLETSDSTDSVNSKSKWTGKSSSTIFDKLRADFSNSSKAPFERVAQIRLTDPSVKQTSNLSPSEIEEQWLDLIEKLKTAILLSFDARVSQYEEDIRDREAQRQMPGWNFCTFFILKEGLAREFENVGLIEDALTIYDELDLGLDTILQEHTSKEDADPTGALLPFSTDLKPAIRSALQRFNGEIEVRTSNTVVTNLSTLIDMERTSFPFDVERKDYQQRILTNQASALDFHIYIFTKELQLLFRQARIVYASSHPKSSGLPVTTTQHDPNTVATICEKSTSFITFASRALRRDLYAAWGGQEGLDDEELQTQEIVIGEIVASWKWSAILQVLANCNVLSLLANVLIDPLSSQDDVDSAHPPGQRMSVNGQAKVSNEDLALWAGELFSMARDVLRTTVFPEDEHHASINTLKQLQSQTLTFLLQSRDTAVDICKLFTIHAYQCFKTANRINASRSMLHALAKLAIADEQVDEALWWLEHVPNLSTLQARTATDRTLLRFYAQCLRMQGRTDDYAQSLVTLLLCTVGNPFARALPRYDEQTQYVLNELVAISEQVSEVTLPLSGFIAIKSVAKCISHTEDHHGVTLVAMLSLRFNAAITISQIELTLSTADDQDPALISFLNRDSVVLDSSIKEVMLGSNTITQGWYNLARLTIRIGNLVLVHDFQAVEQADGESGRVPVSVKPPLIITYPHSDALLMQCKPSPHVDLNKSRCLSFEMSTGTCEIDQCILRLRPGTAGVGFDVQAARLDEKDAVAVRFEVSLQDDHSYTIIVRNLRHHGKLKFEVPYSAEVPSSSIVVKVEASCTTRTGAFSAFYQHTVDISLPINVNVQDIFQVDRLFSRFTAVPSTTVPLRVIGWTIQEDSSFEIAPDNMHYSIVDTLPGMPVSWVIEPRLRGSDLHKLPLTVRYQSYNEIILGTLDNNFRRAIQSNVFSFASEVLVSHLLAQMSNMLTAHDMELAVLLQEVEVYPYENFKWENVLHSLDSLYQLQTKNWLMSWHATNQYISLNILQAPEREVRLLVEMPKPTIVVSTYLALKNDDQHYLAIGEPVAAELRMECVCNALPPVELQFDVASHPDMWLIGGKRRGAFDATERTKTVNLILIAQKTGHMILPSIDIRLRPSVGNDEVHVTNIEVESKTQVKSVLVIPNLQTTTIAISQNDDARGYHWTIDSRTR